MSSDRQQSHLTNFGAMYSNPRANTSMALCGRRWQHRSSLATSHAGMDQLAPLDSVTCLGAE